MPLRQKEVLIKVIESVPERVVLDFITTSIRYHVALGDVKVINSNLMIYLLHPSLVVNNSYYYVIYAKNLISLF